MTDAVLDFDGVPINEGDTVHCVVEGNGILIQANKTFTVERVKSSRIGRGKIWLKETSYWWSADRFRKGLGPDINPVERKADQIMALINGRPWSPSRDEILEILKS